MPTDGFNLTDQSAPLLVGVEDSHSKTRILELLAKMDNPEVPLPEISRGIASEIARIAAEIADEAEITTPTVKTQFRVKALESQVKALRELNKTLMESEGLAKRDTLNFDGPKFQYVLSEIIKLICNALRQVQMSEGEINDVMRIFRDLLGVYEPTIRKETERVINK